LPYDSYYIKLGFRIVGCGKAYIKNITFGDEFQFGKYPFKESNVLLITNCYPSYDNIYYCGFIHKRVREYIKYMKIDIFQLNNKNYLYREFENININEGNSQFLKNFLDNNNYEVIMIHFFNETLWKTIKPFMKNKKIFIWIHGIEIQPWERRSYEFVDMNDKEIKERKLLCTQRINFWKEFLAQNHQNVHYIFVSNLFKKDCESDLNFVFPKERTFIIHNFIDTNLFKYKIKEKKDRLKLLSIRPYESRTYANDLTINALLLLKEKVFFKELDICLVGDGKYFDKLTSPLKNFSNVRLIKKFLFQKEIAKYHSKYGVFLVPTRMDSQGVSRDEAMASGLVPITTNNAAIPEFVNNTCGIIVEPENPKAIAEAIEFLYKNPNKFLELSKNASMRVNQQLNFKQTIIKELEIIKIYKNL
jgi:glycosyltransferase involved in cell wall biosynthesis